MSVERKHLAGLELALSIADTVCTDSIGVGQLEALIEQAKAAPAPASEDGLNQWAKGKFGLGGRFTGEICGNTDWALTRLVWSAALDFALQKGDKP